jgi:hypothetical protein
MSTKGFNKIEQHVEKAVLGIAALVALGAVAFQFISVPVVKVGQKDVSPGEVDALLEAKARALSSQLADAGIQFESGSLEPAAPRFREGLQAEISPARSLAATSPNFNSRLLTKSGASSDQWFYVPVVPPLRMKGVDEHADALTAASAAKAKAVSPFLAGLADFSSVEGPKDVVWTTPYAVIDLKALRAELRRGKPDSTPPLSPVPSIWYEERANPPIVDIVFERRKREASGQWGAAEVVPVFAERSDELMLRDEIAAPPMGFRSEAFALLGDEVNQREILQPPFYETVNGAFVSPSADEAEGETPSVGVDKAAAAEIQRRKQMRTGLDRRRQRAESLRAEIEKLGGLWDEEAEKQREEERRRDERERRDAEKGSGSGGGGSGGGGGGGGGLGGGPMSGKNNASNDGAREDLDRNRKRREKSREYRKLEAEIADLEKRLGLNAPEPGAAPKAAPTLAALDEVLVWAHDLEVEFGETYQYRCVARLLSPFFGKGNQLVQEQDSKLANTCTLDSVASEWSQPYTVSPRVQFFVTRASIGEGAAAPASVQFEVYKFDGGKWCSDDVTVQVGEQVGRTESVNGKSVDFSTSFVVLDVIEDRDSERTASGGSTKRPALVVIAPIGGGEAELRIPAVDAGSPARNRLSAKAALVEQGGDTPGKAAESGAAGARPPGPNN